jgi:hypothetical protein
MPANIGSVEQGGMGAFRNFAENDLGGGIVAGNVVCLHGRVSALSHEVCSSIELMT